MTTMFWTNDFIVLFDKNYIFDVIPDSTMTKEEKYNAISRLLIYASLIIFICTHSYLGLLLDIFLLLVIVWSYNNNVLENFSNNLDQYNTEEKKYSDNEKFKNVLKKNYVKPTRKNPLSNVLITDIEDNPNRQPAPPSFDPYVVEQINEKTKEMIQSLNPTIKNTNKQLFGDLGQKFEFEQSMRSFYSTPNTRVANDQGAFSKFLYGDMPSCKSGNVLACIQNNQRYNLY